MTAKKKVHDIVKKLIIGLVITVVLTIAMTLYGYGNICWVVGVLGIVASILLSKSYLLLKKGSTTGIITDLNVKVYTNRARPSGDKMDSPIIDEKYPAYGAYSERVIILTVDSENGKITEKTFLLNKNTEKLKVGDKIRYTEFDDFPQVVT